MVTRLVGNRGVGFRRKLRLAEDVARKCRMRYAETVEYDSAEEGVKKGEGAEGRPRTEADGTRFQLEKTGPTLTP